jgi:hypothetical protein
VRVKHLAAASAASGLLTLGLVPSAYAAPPSSTVVVKPDTVAPGGQVSVFGIACTVPTGTATSSVFTAPIPLSMLSNATGGVGTVSKHARPGTWRVIVTCGGKRFTGWISVCDCAGKPTPTPTPNPSSSGVPSGKPKPVRPRGGAATGDGASQASAASGAESLGLGAVLTAAGLGVGAVAVRRRRRAGDQG